MSDRVIKFIVTFTLIILATLAVVGIMVGRNHAASSPVPTPTYTVHTAQNAKIVAARHGCKRFKQGGAPNVGSCFIGTQKFEVVTFVDHATQVETMKSTKQYGYKYLVVAPKAVIYSYSG